MIHPLNCKAATTKLALGDLSKMSWGDRLSVRFHLAICWVCRKYEKQVKVISKAFEFAASQAMASKDMVGFKKRLVQGLSK
jgi:hypothetical protein